MLRSMENVFNKNNLAVSVIMPELSGHPKRTENKSGKFTTNFILPIKTKHSKTMFKIVEYTVKLIIHEE